MHRIRTIVLIGLSAATVGLAACDTSSTSPLSNRHPALRAAADSTDSTSLGGFVTPDGHL